MLNKKNITGIILHALFWILIITLAIIFREPRLGGVLLRYQIAFTTLGIGIVTFYLHFHLSKKLLYDRFSIKWLLINLISITVITICYYLLVGMFIEAKDNQYPEHYSLPIVLFFSIAGMMFQGFHFSLTQRKKEQNLEKEKLDLEVNLIRSQLNPHFLFNVLNNIDSFIKNDPIKASDSIIRLSDLLRYLLYETSEHRVLVENEVNFLKIYFDLQKQRIRENAICTLALNGNSKGNIRGSALFLPFLENAFIHSSLNEPETYLNFQIKLFDNKIVFFVINSKTSARTPILKEQPGLGLELSKKRLELLYGNLYTLDILDKETFFSVELTLPIETDENKMYNY